LILDPTMTNLGDQVKSEVTAAPTSFRTANKGDDTVRQLRRVRMTSRVEYCRKAVMRL